jgi:hypothetical protein
MVKLLGGSTFSKFAGVIFATAQHAGRVCKRSPDGYPFQILPFESAGRACVSATLFVVAAPILGVVTALSRLLCSFLDLHYLSEVAGGDVSHTQVGHECIPASRIKVALGHNVPLKIGL